MHYLNQLSPSKRGYALINRSIHWLSKFLMKDWDRRLLGLSSLPIRSILDIGANEGQFSKRMRSLFPDAQIYAFEPLPDAFKVLNAWAKTQRGTVQVFDVALGETEQVLALQQHLYFSASSSILPTTALGEEVYPIMSRQQPISVTQTTLDGAIAQLHQCPKPDVLIKLDVQGYEDRVIRGGLQTFAQAKACIIEISLDALYDGQATFQTIFELLSGLGYCYCGNLDQIQARDGHVIYFNALFINIHPTPPHHAR